MKHRFAESADGGAYCAQCGGEEWSLPTECPGQVMTVEEVLAVSEGRWDFRFGGWSRFERRPVAQGRRFITRSNTDGATAGSGDAKFDVSGLRASTTQ